MLRADLEKGVIAASGDVIQILTEFTVVSKVLMNTLESNYGSEAMQKLVAAAGQIAYEDYKDPSSNFANIPKRFEELLGEDNE